MSAFPLPVFDAVAPLRAQVAAWRGAGERIVLVPTMGALHAGHLALVAQARAIGERVVASIFVNPTQFGPNEDFSRYPRDVEADLALLAEAGVHATYLPDAAAMYPADFSTRIEVGGVSAGLCGTFRPGHFSGVATVVTKLINQAQPDVALFGEKDFQQLQVIRRTVRDLDIPVAIAGVSTLREADGLALSSRNRYLSPDERARAPRLHAALARIAAGLNAGEAAHALVARGRADLEAAGFGPIQYLEVRDAGSLEPVADIKAGPVRVLVAAYLGTTRLIDNVAAG